MSQIIRFFICIMFSLVLFFGNAYAEDATIQGLQNDVSVAKSKADKNATGIHSLKEGLPAEVEARRAADENLQQQINNIQLIPGPEGPQGEQGPPGICEDCNSFTPPTIAHNAPPFTSDIEVDVTFTLSDDVELSHFIIQGEASPYVQLTQYFDPGIADITITHTFGLNSGTNEILAIAYDTEGNAGKILIEIDQGIVDFDLDGFTNLEYGGTDCDDTDASIYPGAEKICGDGIDQNCDGADTPCSCYDDVDGDGYVSVACGGTDCNDSDYWVNPGIDETHFNDLCGDGIDNDCDGGDSICIEP